MIPFTDKIDRKVAAIADKEFTRVAIEELQALIAWTKPDQALSERVWDSVAVAESVGQFAKLHNQDSGYVWIDRDRDLDANRRETAGVLSGGEVKAVPADKVALFLLRTKPARGRNASWWPQIRFPDGRYAFAFAV